jgi:hypothetical protein
MPGCDGERQGYRQRRECWRLFRDIAHLVKSFWVIAGAAASTEVKSRKVPQKNQAISFSFLGPAASKLLRATIARASNVTP